MLYLLVALCGSTMALSEHPILIVVSFDAFRWDFIKTEHLPHMVEFQREGVYADYLINVFPTKTFPNHHSIATGLFTESHGVVGNSFYDPLYGKVLTIGPEMYQYNKDVKPIWRLNEDAGNGRYSASVMWPGANYQYQNKTIQWTMPFKSGYDWHKRVDQAIEWINHPTQPANLVMLYFEEPDTHGHAFGPNSATVKNLLQQLDEIVDYLQQQLKNYDISQQVNLVFLSDHGMTAVSPPKFINITQYMPNGKYQWAGASPAIQIIPVEGYEDVIYNSLKAHENNNYYKVYKKLEYLDRWHYGNNRRAPPILVMANSGYALDDLILNAIKYAKKYNFTLTNASEFGLHGYDYTDPEMHPYFMARGPKFLQQLKVEPFNTIDLFNLFCTVLDLSPTPNNGTMIAVERTLRPEFYSFGTIILLSLGGITILLLLIVLTIVFALMAIKRKQTLTTTAALNKRFTTFQNYVEAQHLLESEDA